MNSHMLHCMENYQVQKMFVCTFPLSSTLLMIWTNSNLGQCEVFWKGAPKVNISSKIMSQFGEKVD
jgi:hypothetical protein